MTESPERAAASKFPTGHSTDPVDTDKVTDTSKQRGSRSKKASLWSSFFSSNLPILETYTSSSSSEKKASKSRNNGWMGTVKRVMAGVAMRRLHDRILGASRADVSSSTSDVWLLGTCYKVSQEETSDGSDLDNGLAAFLLDFSSRIWITYRKGFEAIGDSRFTSDVNWGCMIRSSQMLVAQALLFHDLGRPWRKPLGKPYSPEYIEIVHRFGDAKACDFSIHNLLEAGKGYGLTTGSWVGPYAMCRTWETLTCIRNGQDDKDKGKKTLPMAVYIVSGDEDGERGGAPVVCVDVAARLCSDFNDGGDAWAPILLLVPLVLGLETMNPRYIPLLWETFTFPQSLGILGGKPGASTYLVGVQDDKTLYLDPHEVQPVVEVKRDNLEADTSSYHCSIVRNMPLDQIDPSLAIGFYCRDKDDFKDFCSRASELAKRSNGAPLFTVTESLNPARQAHHPDSSSSGTGTNEVFYVDKPNSSNVHEGEDDWQLL